MSKPLTGPDGGGIREVSLETALGERYLAYALSTITARSLPDARDGLKPVHRRLLYAMRQLQLDPASGYKKCARVVGDVIGKFHPHGEQAVYAALVRLAQEFAARYLLVDGQGNFGNVDGDGAAAMRYTEARLTEFAQALLAGIDEDTVDFRSTYDGEASEPLVLPAAVPNLLANGANGIAVGMATSIPPHNVGELCDALLHLIEAPAAPPAELAARLPGPDFPTGGVLVEPSANIMAAYATGRGSFRLRARWDVEKGSRGSWTAVVTEIPYQVQKSRLIERIADLIQARKLPLLADVRDESAEDVRLVLEPRSRTVLPDVLMESLFEATELDVRIPLNLNVLDRGVPRVLGLRDALQVFLDHRHEVVARRTQFRLARAEARLEALEGYLVVFAHLDELIRIVREDDEPKARLVERFALTERQADAVLDLRLRRLRRLEEEAIRSEHAQVSKDRDALQLLARDESRRWAVVADEVGEIRERFGAQTALGRRRTVIAGAPDRVAMPAAVVQREPMTVICSEKGWIRTAKGHAEDDSSVRYKEGDRARFWFPAESVDRIAVFATNGRLYTLAVDRLPGARGMGDPVKLMVDLADGDDVVAVFVLRTGAKILVASSDGRGFLAETDRIAAHTRQGRQVLNLTGGAEAAACVPVDGDTVAVVGENRKLLVFPLDELPVLPRGRGVLLQKYRDGGLSDVKVFRRAEGLSWRLGGRTRTETDLGIWSGKRAQAGRPAPKGFPRSGRFG